MHEREEGLYAPQAPTNGALWAFVVGDWAMYVFSQLHYAIQVLHF